MTEIRLPLGLSDRPGFKAFLIALLVLGLLIPLALVEELVEDRRGLRDAAEESVLEGGGGRPALLAPYLAIPYSFPAEDARAPGELLVLPEELSLEARIATEPRRKGLFTVPLLEAELELRGVFAFSRAELQAAAPPGARLDPGSARLRLELADLRSLRGSPSLSAGGQGLVLRGEPGRARVYGRALGAAVAPEPGPGGAYGLAFEASLPLRGGRALSILAPGGTVRASVEGDWPAPSFEGYVSPAERSLGPEGFSASWYLPESAQALPRVAESEALGPAAAGEAFGLLLIDPLDAYATTYRAVRYAALFLVLPFLALFLLEVLGGRRLHPVQYLLVGLADCVFYLLLLSLGELLPFGLAYLAAALATSLLVTAYAASSLGRRGLLLLPLLGLLYAYLYAALRSEDYALLIGSLGLFLMLGGTMAATRRVDWFGSGPASGAGRRSGGAPGPAGSAARGAAPPGVGAGEPGPGPAASLSGGDAGDGDAAR